MKSLYFVIYRPKDAIYYKVCCKKKYKNVLLLKNPQILANRYETLSK